MPDDDIADADSLVRAARTAIVNETGEPDHTAIGPVVTGRPDDLASVAAEAILRELAKDGDTWEADILDAFADEIEQPQAGIGGGRG